MFITAGSCSVMLLCPTRRMFCCQGKVDGSTGASLAGREMSFGAVPVIAASAIGSADIAAGFNVWRLAANGTDAALALRKVRRLSMRSIMADYRLSYERTVAYSANQTLAPVCAVCKSGSMHYERAPCCRRVEARCGAAFAPLRRARM